MTPTSTRPAAPTLALATRLLRFELGSMMNLRMRALDDDQNISWTPGPCARVLLTITPNPAARLQPKPGAEHASRKQHGKPKFQTKCAEQNLIELVSRLTTRKVLQQVPGARGDRERQQQ